MALVMLMSLARQGRQIEREKIIQEKPLEREIRANQAAKIVNRGRNEKRQAQKVHTASLLILNPNK